MGSDLRAATGKWYGGEQMNLLVKNLHALALSLFGIGVILSGCATVTSKKSEGVGKGLTYYLPKRDVKITIERTLVVSAEIKKALADKQEALKTVVAELGAAKKALATAQARIKSAAVQGNATAKDEIEAAIALATADVGIATERQGELKSEIEKLEQKLAASERTDDGKCLYEYAAKLELLPLTADVQYGFVANIAHNVLRDDTMKLGVTTDGLLTSANVVADDKTGSILVELASAIASGRSGSLAMAGNTRNAKPPACERVKSKFVYSFDPVTKSKDVSDRMQKAGYPFVIATSGEKRSYGADGEKCSHEKDGEKCSDQVWKSLNNLNEQYKGSLFYRSPHPYTLHLRQCNKPTMPCEIEKEDEANETESVPIDAVTFNLPQAGPISYIPMNSRAFVKTVDDVVFENGMLKSWDATRPSEVLEIVRLPVSILKAVVSVPAEIVKLRVELSDQQKGLAASQQAQLSAQAKLAVIQSCVETAGDDKEAALACFP